MGGSAIADDRAMMKMFRGRVAAKFKSSKIPIRAPHKPDPDVLKELKKEEHEISKVAKNCQGIWNEMQAVKKSMKESNASDEEIDAAEAEYKTKLNTEIGKAPGKNLAQKANNILYELWIDYDKHMGAHEKAIGYLLQKILNLNRFVKERGEIPIIGSNILEMSVGTGTIIDMIARALPPEEASELMVVANDISITQHERTRRKIEKIPEERRPNIGFLRQDIRELDLPANLFNTVLLFQTLHLINDPQLVEENITNRFHNGKHLLIKKNVIEKALECLEWGGRIIFVDEWNPLLTRNADDLVSYLFTCFSFG